MTHERDDKRSEREFEAYLEGDSEVSQSYARLKGVEPPEPLDRAVLAQAEAAADETRGRRRRPFWSSWSSRIAAVAVVTLAVAVTLRLAVVPDRMPQGLERDLSSPTAGRAASLPGADADSSDRRSNYSVGMDMPMTEAGDQPELSEAPSMRDQDDLGPLKSLRQSNVGRPQEFAAAKAPSPAAAPPVAADEAVTVPPAGPASLYNVDSDRPDSPDIEASGFLPVTEQGDTDPGPWRAAPERWLEYVDLLIEEGDDDAVRRELAAFREEWPDVELAERYETWLGDSPQ